MNLAEMQLAVDTWIKTQGHGYWGRFEILARLTEELGEVSAALQRDQGLRPRKTTVDLAGEVASVCVHGDSPGAVAHAHAVRRALEAAGYRVAPFVDVS